MSSVPRFGLCSFTLLRLVQGSRFWLQRPTQHNEIDCCSPIWRRFSVPTTPMIGIGNAHWRPTLFSMLPDCVPEFCFALVEACDLSEYVTSIPSSHLTPTSLTHSGFYHIIRVNLGITGYITSNTLLLLCSSGIILTYISIRIAMYLAH